MRKDELEKDRNKWKNKAEELQYEIDALNDYVYDLECQLADCNDPLLNGKEIKCLTNFMWRLQVDGLLTDELEKFIEEYLRWHNI